MRFKRSTPVPVAPSPARRRRGLVVAAVVAGLGILGPGLGAGSAGAATVVPACSGTTSTPVTASMLELSGAREAAFQNGDAVVLYTNDGTFSGGDQTPACAVHEVNGVAVADWAYCTDLTKRACVGPADPELAPITGNPRFAPITDPLGPDKEKVIAFLAQHGYPIRDSSAPEFDDPNVPVADNASTAQRDAVQELIWCVSEAGPGVKAAAWQLCLDNFTAADFDAVLALISATPTLGITSPSPTPLDIGQVARFVVETNVLEQPITLSRSANATWTVCDGDATLAGDDLVVHGNGGRETITLCATATAAGTITVDAASIPASDRNLVWSWNGDAGCQVFATFMAAKVERLTASGAATVRAPEVPTTPTTPTTPTSPVATPAEVTRISTLRITKTSARTSLRPGQRVTYRIRVTNPSSTTVRNVRVCDTMPRGLVFAGASPQARLRGGRHCWTVRSLGAKRSASFRLVARVSGDAPARVTNRASASSPDVRRTAVAERTVRVERSVAKAGGVTG